MKAALIFLNGYYDTRHLDFYRQEIESAAENRCPLICADGGIRIFDALNRRGDTPCVPDVHIGDMDSVTESTTKAKLTVQNGLDKRTKIGQMDSLLWTTLWNNTGADISSSTGVYRVRTRTRQISFLET